MLEPIIWKISIMNGTSKATLQLYFAKFYLELRPYKNDSIMSKIIPILKLPRFFATYTVHWGKTSAISKLELFLTEWSCSCTVFALVKFLWKFSLQSCSTKSSVVKYNIAERLHRKKLHCTVICLCREGVTKPFH